MRVSLPFQDLYDVAPAASPQIIVHQCWAFQPDGTRTALQTTAIPLPFVAAVQDALSCRSEFARRGITAGGKAYWLGRWVHGPYTDGRWGYNLGSTGIVATRLLLDIEMDDGLLFTDAAVA